VAIEDFSQETVQSVKAGIQMIGTAIETLPQAMMDCQGAE